LIGVSVCTIVEYYYSPLQQQNIVRNEQKDMFYTFFVLNCMKMFVTSK
jgi:hypothetical protein